MTQVKLSGHIIVPQQQLALIKEALVEHTQLTLAEVGCIKFEVKQCELDNCKFYVDELFTDESAFNYHQQRVQNSAWGAVTKDVQRFYKVKKI
ncbi:putative quinol monooxygenase [Paraferrimonas sp. SM1919]|uniref:putative quinol monooxygenase n=1 Tax=Paraferrimonas sp. SM1919 TaxID=2662263 RepID=UPI0013D84BF6|nr:antibiotic biosynthesis monooxygenase [Paraferrimonas sp. SM1919]